MTTLRAGASDLSFQKRGTEAPGKMGISTGKNYSIYGDNCAQRRLELRLSCAAKHQSVPHQPLGAICAEILGLARRLRGVRNHAPAPRGRADAGGPMEDIS